MFRKNIKLFLRKYLLFLIPLFLLILYFLFPVPEVTIKSLSHTANQKERADKIITSYEYAISPAGIKQLVEECVEECRNDPIRRDRSLYLCKDRCRRKVFSPDKISPEEIERCVRKCEEPDELLSECEYIYCREHIIIDKYIIDTIDGFGTYEIKQSSFIGLFFKNFSKYFTSAYQKLIKNFHFQNIIIIFLGLIVYYGVIFGITITKRLEKQK